MAGGQGDTLGADGRSTQNTQETALNTERTLIRGATVITMDTQGDLPVADILVEAFAEEAIYPVGSTPTLTLSVTNIGTRPCKRDVGPGANELQITQGEVTIWSSDDCNPNEDKDVVTLDRGDAFETQLVWDGYLSAAGCPPDQPMAQAGEYTVVGRNGAIVSAPTALRLE